MVLLSGREGWPYRKIAEKFNLRHPYRQPICFTAVGKLVNKFKETGSVLDKPRSGQPKASDETREAVLAKVYASPKKSLRRTSAELGIPRSTIHRILGEDRFHPYKLQILHHLNQGSPTCGPRGRNITCGPPRILAIVSAANQGFAAARGMFGGFNGS